MVAIPSHELHEKWSRLMGIPSHIAMSIDSLLDSVCGVHDIGKFKIIRVPVDPL